MSWKRNVLYSLIEYALVALLFGLLYLACTGCQGLEAGDVVPDYLELHGGGSATDLDHPRQLLNELEGSGSYLGVTLGWHLTQTEPEIHYPDFDASEVVAGLESVRTAVESLAPEKPVYGPELPPTDDAGSWVEGHVPESVAILLVSLAAVLALLRRFDLLPGVKKKDPDPE